MTKFKFTFVFICKHYKNTIKLPKNDLAFNVNVAMLLSFSILAKVNMNLKKKQTLIKRQHRQMFDIAEENECTSDMPILSRQHQDFVQNLDNELSFDVVWSSNDNVIVLQAMNRQYGITYLRALQLCANVKYSE
ncbi:Hypothetical_protein [Hexamita inflata]|uniref:Hypothetical_protein n=1 Tax=Hexamita inflata TaxID=28002 RepID=A0AA86U0Y0_9EUKA|nr:Hypothetical protein HINF_LOCUS25305 [Hexamita inflata]CAI9937661.1 Hypothetical protein HINF_LOCUS25306 [Hexamita inflata]CAI9937662.1 Hypothetical protein HINF_LOCUS25307 [Hexamita inflata]